MKSIIFKSLLLVLLTPFYLKAQIVLEKRSFIDGKIELLVPKDFEPMTAARMDAKYPNRNQQPYSVLTNDNASVNIVISPLKQSFQADQIAEFKDFQINLLKKMRPDAKWLDNGVKIINGKNVGYFKFISSAVDQNVYNYYFFTDMDGKILLLTFNCTEKLLPTWKDVAENIVSSLKVK